MSELRYCPNCQRNIIPVRSWNTTALVLLIIFLFPIGLIYGFAKRKRKCPICGTPEKAMGAPITVR